MLMQTTPQTIQPTIYVYPIPSPPILQGTAILLQITPSLPLSKSIIVCWPPVVVISQWW